VSIDAAGQRIVLLPQKAAWLPQSATLLVADAHIGKAVSFRRLGVPVPAGTTAETLRTLDALVQRHGARRIVFLGDFLHSARAHAASTMAQVHDWRARHAALELALVRGNHDAHAGDPPAGLGIAVHDEPLMLGGLALCHHPRPRAEGYVVAGHLHPCVALGGRAHDWHRLPCFWFGERVAVLPAFGAFTGMHDIRPRRGDRVFAAAGERVVEVSPRR
jgi:DNA ligase-associated metallophosphoesterase